MSYNKKYIDKMNQDPFPCLQEDERIYLNVPYTANGFARRSHCGFDSKKKLWFTGIHNVNLSALLRIYGINDVTSEKMKQMIAELQTE